MTVDNLGVPTVRRFVDNRHDLAITEISASVRHSSTFPKIVTDRNATPIRSSPILSMISF